MTVWNFEGYTRDELRAIIDNSGRQYRQLQQANGLVATQALQIEHLRKERRYDRKLYLGLIAVAFVVGVMVGAIIMLIGDGLGGFS